MAGLPAVALAKAGLNYYLHGLWWEADWRIGFHFRDFLPSKFAATTANFEGRRQSATGGGGNTAL